MANAFVAPTRLNGIKDIRVLIADQDESLLGEYRKHSRDGLEVVTAPNGLECVERLREQVPDVLVLEPQLPWGGGDGVLAMMHDVLDLGTVPVMILTSCSDSMVLDGFSRFPIRDFQSKPLSPAQLMKRLHTLLEDHTSRSTFTDQNRRLESLIAKETGGRIHRLRVETLNGRTIVHGRTGTYHARQLALAVVMDAIKASHLEPRDVELDIQIDGQV